MIESSLNSNKTSANIAKTNNLHFYVFRFLFFFIKNSDGRIRFK